MPRKKGNGEGTVYNNGKYWVGQVTLGRNPETGKLKRKSFYGKTKREVMEKMTAVKYELNTDTYIEPSDMLMKEWAAYWLETFKKPVIADTTYNRYQSLIKNHVIKPLGYIKVKDLNTFQLQEYFNHLPAKGLGDAMIERIHVNLNAMLKKAVSTKIIKENPCSDTVLPRTGKKRKIEVLTKEEQKQFVEYCANKKNGQLFIFLLGTGLRIGEALALTWDKIDFDNDLVEVNQSAAEISGHSQIKDKTKTPAGMRVVPLSPKIKELLINIQEQQNRDKNNLNLIFPSQEYSIALSSNIRTRLYAYWKAAKIQKIGVHALRHTFATRALEQGVNVKVLSVILGHKDIKVTLNTYAHILADFKKENLSMIDIFL